MLRACALVGLTKVAFAAVADDQCVFDVQEATCFGGTTIKTVTVSSIDECCTTCQATAKCTHFTFSKDTRCGIKVGTPVNSSHTHCTSGVMNGPAPAPTPPAPAPTPTPAPTPAPSPTPPKPTPSGAKYQINGKCLSIGDKYEPKDPNSFKVILTDCESAVEWTEGLTDKEPHFGHPKISTTWKKSADGTICLTLNPSKGIVVANRCEDRRKGNERATLRVYWDPSRNAVVSVFKNPDYCMDVDGDQLVTKLCSETGKWTRVGPPGPEPPLPPLPHLKPAALVGNYSMFWPLAGGVTGINKKGYPDYWGNNLAEACPPERRTQEFGGQCHFPDLADVPMFKGKKHKVPNSTYTMTRSMILQRAIVWVANHFAGQDYIDWKHNAVGVEGCSEGDSRSVCPQYFHGGSCCSLPSMAWNISGCVINGPGPHGERINCKDMRPGDAISYGGSHVVLFKGWTREDKKNWHYMYQRKGPANVAQRGLSSNTFCMRRKNLHEDVEPHNIPLALPPLPGDYDYQEPAELETQESVDNTYEDDSDVLIV